MGKTAKKIGRPTKLSPETQEKIVTCVAAGNYIDVAAAYAGVAKSTVYEWMSRAHVVMMIMWPFRTL